MSPSYMFTDVLCHFRVELGCTIAHWKACPVAILEAVDFDVAPSMQLLLLVALFYDVFLLAKHSLPRVPTMQIQYEFNELAKMLAINESPPCRI